jgi:hypothetical protein
VSSFIFVEKGRSVLRGVDYPGCQVDYVCVNQRDITEARGVKSNRRDNEYNGKANEPSALSSKILGSCDAREESFKYTIDGEGRDVPYPSCKNFWGAC